jgi:hypothetical protein
MTIMHSWHSKWILGTSPYFFLSSSSDISASPPQPHWGQDVVILYFFFAHDFLLSLLFSGYSRIRRFTGTIRGIAGIVHKGTLFFAGRTLLRRCIRFQIVSALITYPTDHNLSPYNYWGFTCSLYMMRSDIVPQPAI